MKQQISAFSNQKKIDDKLSLNCAKFAMHLFEEIERKGFEETHKQHLIVTLFLAAAYKKSVSATYQDGFEQEFKRNLRLGLSMAGLLDRFFDVIPEEKLLQYKAKDIYKFVLKRANVFTLPEYITFTMVSLKILWNVWEIQNFSKQPDRIGVTLFAACFALKIEADSFFLK